MNPLNIGDWVVDRRVKNIWDSLSGKESERYPGYRGQVVDVNDDGFLVRWEPTPAHPGEWTVGYGWNMMELGIQKEQLTTSRIEG